MMSFFRRRSGRQYSTLRVVAVPAEAADVAASEAEGPTALYQSSGVRSYVTVVLACEECKTMLQLCNQFTAAAVHHQAAAACNLFYPSRSEALSCLPPRCPAGAQGGAAGAADRCAAGLVRLLVCIGRLLAVRRPSYGMMCDCAANAITALLAGAVLSA